MNQTDQALADMIDKIGNNVQDLVKFLISNAPDTAYQLVSYTLWSDVVTSVITVVIFGVTFFFGIKNWILADQWQEKHGKESTPFYAGISMVCLVLAGISGALIIFGGIREVKEIMECILAPKWFIIEHAATILKAKS